jgi:hypothetical protein
MECTPDAIECTTVAIECTAVAIEFVVDAIDLIAVAIECMRAAIDDSHMGISHILSEFGWIYRSIDVTFTLGMCSLDDFKPRTDFAGSS